MFRLHQIAAMLVRHIRLTALFKFTLVCLLQAQFQTTALAAFRAAATQVDITPAEPQWLLGYGARQSTGVNDRLYHRIAVLDDGKVTIFLISTDIAVLSPAYVDTVKEHIRKELGIEPERIWWTVTHTHSAPDVGPPGLPAIFMPERYKQASSGQSNVAYTEFQEKKLIEGLKQVRAQLQPARIGLGVGFSTANINRRALDLDGKVRLGMNPDRPADRQIGLIRLEKLDGGIIALIANYAIHGTVLGSANLSISGDAPGVVAQYVGEKIGAPMLFINGAEGDMAPIYSGYPDPPKGHLGEFRLLLGNRILEANDRIVEKATDVSLTETQVVVETPLRRELTWPSDLKQYSRVVGGGTLVRIPVWFLQINHEAVVWGAPLELFCQIAMDVRAKSRFPFTFYFGLLNGTLDYLPTAEAVREQGYEPSVSPFSDRGEYDFVQSVVKHLDSLPR